MSQKPIREYDAKKLLSTQWKKYFGDTELEFNFKSHLIKTADHANYPTANAQDWLSKKLVTKPDELFGKRGKNGLVLVNKNLTESLEWIKEKSATTTALQSGVSGVLNTFVIEPFLAHKPEDEYYLSFTTKREYTELNISKSGGIDIEQHWEEKVDTIKIEVGEKLEWIKDTLKDLGYDASHHNFVAGMYQLFCDQDFAYLEFNPYCIIGNEVFLLDCVAKLDDTSQFFHGSDWKGIDFVSPFGSLALTPQEALIEQLDSRSGASLKLRMLNTQGDIYPLFSGGGASIAMMDLITSQIGSKHLALYGEYSGNPTTDETTQYTQAVIDLMIQNNKDLKPRILLIVGAIANFTDIYKTFLGIIEALKSNIKSLKTFPLTVVVRRGGPNAAKALKAMEDTCQQLGLAHYSYTHDTELHQVVQTLPNYL
jgi:ATP-citrate lyase beta-subunit